MLHRIYPIRAQSRGRHAGAGNEELHGALLEVPWERRRRLQAEWSLTDEELRDLVNAGALDLIEATVAAGAPAGEA